jgi:hypothetical protein
MLIESLGLALIVLFAAKAQHLYCLQASSAAASLPSMELMAARWPSNPTFYARLVSFCGAGLYEELVFRLLLLPVLIYVLRQLGWHFLPAAAMAIFVSSMLFAGAHYDLLNPAGTAFEWPGFTVRMLASVFFASVFLLRGFGIAVGTHVAYDVLTQL